MMFMQNSDPNTRVLEEKWRLIESGNILPIFYSSVLVSVLFLADRSVTQRGLVLL